MSEYEACILGLRLATDMGIQELLVLGDSDLLVHQIEGEWETRDPNLIPYQHCLQDLCQRFVSIKFRHIPRVHNEIADALATFSSILQHPDNAHIDPLYIQICDQHAYCNMVEDGFFLSGGILYKKTTDLGLLRCVNAKEASTIMIEVHSGVCGPHMNGYVLARKILRAGYYWLTMEWDSI
ncbi:hypothetical protein R3W88_007884 [Solanum pinnatisectum]|uniref:RNase H type-1 domain-containing protein n=1 Tax=Solanum pinnatisectum TaxID=50273 RepID=A0AAV9M7B7_9SOLN|nr:hypothetical protein R3W88_007884 [Solanum pinnatisectum]